MQNLIVAVFPSPLSPERIDSDSTSDEESLVAVPPSDFTNSRHFFHAKISETAAPWFRHWEQATVLDSQFQVWLDNCGLKDRSASKANAEKFWSTQSSA
jgi:hypothetical protein